MSVKLDYKKEYKNLYQPKTVPMIVDVPKMKFIMIDGKGNPNNESGEYVKAIELLYGLSYTIKMSNKSGNAPSDFVEYVVPPLEGLWWTEVDRPFDTSQKEKLIWTAMIRQPEFVTDELFKWAVDELKKRKPQPDTSKVRLEEFTEGLCVQMMHLGPYDTEAITVKAIDDFAASNGYINAISEVCPDGTIRRHHEIYLSDPRRVAPEKMKTVVRHPIRKYKIKVVKEYLNMGKVDEYRKILKNLDDWDHYLLDESRLPGPRANLELAEAAAEEGDIDSFRRYLAYGPDEAPYGSALEFLPVCGVIGLGRVLSEGRVEILEELRIYASDPRWRVREGVAMALQRFGEKNMDRLLQEMEKWSHGNLTERRAVAAALCEPRLLKNPEDTQRVLGLLDQITNDILLEDRRKTDEFIVLRKALGYCWSVAVVASPEAGKRMLKKWFANQDKDIRWIMKENLKKNRLQKMDMGWTERWQSDLTKKIIKPYEMTSEEHELMVNKMEEKLIAPCGMNCGVCVSYLAKKNDINKKGFKKTYCDGCLPCSKNCILKKHCKLLKKGLVRFCYECDNFPCSQLKAIDKRYRTKYHMSMIENLEFIREHGIEKFLEKEEIKWRCPECGGVICCHTGLCLNCNLDKLRQNKKYRWGEE